MCIRDRDEEGLQRAYAIPERLETFVETVNNYIADVYKRQLLY